MNVKKLANKVVAIGIGRREKLDVSMAHGPRLYYGIGDGDDCWLSAEEFVQDWRVTGACFEALDRTVHDMVSLIQSAEIIEQRERNWPRAIIEACVDDLEPVLDRREPE